MNMGGAERVTVHELQELSSTEVERDRVGGRLEDDGGVPPLVVGLEAPSAVKLRLLRGLGVVEPVWGLGGFKSAGHNVESGQKEDQHRARRPRWRP